MGKKFDYENGIKPLNILEFFAVICAGALPCLSHSLKNPLHMFIVNHLTSGSMQQPPFTRFTKPAVHLYINTGLMGV
jgi:hypothetical protein